MKLKTEIRKLTIILLLLLITATSLYAQYSRGCTVKIFTKGSKKDLPKIRSLILLSDLMVSRILPKKSSKPLEYSVVLLEKDELKKDGILNQGPKSLRFYLSEDMHSWQSDDKVLSNIIASIILKKSSTSGGENTSVIPEWMTHALVRKIERRQQKITIPGTISYPGVHALVLSGTKIDWLEMVTGMPPPEELNAHEIYKEASEIILDSILRLPEGKQAILDMVELANKGINKKDLFQSVLGKKIYNLESHMTFSNPESDSNNILQQWLNYNFRISSVNTFTPCSATDAEKLFIKAEVVSYRAKTGEEENAPVEERFCKIEELPEKLDEIINLKSVLIKKQRDLARIAFAIPIPLQDYMYKMQKSLDLLLTAKDDKALQETFRKMYLHEKQGFYQELERQNQIEVYILKTEATFVPPGYRYYAEINAMKDVKEIERERWPALTKLLDQNDAWQIEKEDQ